MRVATLEVGQNVVIEAMKVLGSSTGKMHVNQRALQTDHSWACL